MIDLENMEVHTEDVLRYIYALASEQDVIDRRMAKLEQKFDALSEPKYTLGVDMGLVGTGEMVRILGFEDPSPKFNLLKYLREMLKL